jgi:LacI family transcriptional regulator
MASINDVARRAGVSISTVSRVMNNHPNVSEEKRKAVFKAIADLNYVPNALAQGLVKKATNTIAVLIADITNMFYANLLKSLEDRLNDKGYYTIIGNTEWNPEKEREYIHYMLQKQVDGIVLASTTLENEDFKKLSLRGIPLVVLDREVNIDRVDRIRIDDYKGGYQATEHLIKAGYRKLVHFSGPRGISSAEDRKKGFFQCVKDYNLSEEKYMVIPGCFTEECGVQNMEQYLEEYSIKEPVGIFAANDAMALGVLKVLNEQGVACPDRVGVVGFDDITFARYSNPPLTTIKRPIKEIGKIVVDTILDRIENQGQEHFHRNITLDVRLVIRESTRLKSGN